VENAGV